MGLKDKAARIDFASLGNVAAPPATGESSSGGARPKTAPGLLMAQTGDQRSELVRENQELKSRVEELSNGVAQVGSAVNDLDRMTQQNAALVEQTAAAASALKDQALGLATEVARFKLPGGH